MSIDIVSQSQEDVKGRGRDNVVAEVSVMVYYTPTFKSHWKQPITKIKEQISFANTFFHDSEIPLKLSLFCTEEFHDFDEIEEEAKC